VHVWCCSSHLGSNMPDGMTKCSLGGKGVCVQPLDGKTGDAACSALKSTCSSVGIVAKSCQ